MRKQSIHDFIKSPLVTEKSTSLSELNKYVFKVNVDKNKLQIKNAVEKIFNVKVTSVNIINMIGKKKVFKGRIGRRQNYKKAIVSISSDQKLDLSIGV